MSAHTWCSWWEWRCRQGPGIAERRPSILVTAHCLQKSPAAQTPRCRLPLVLANCACRLSQWSPGQGEARGNSSDGGQALHPRQGLRAAVRFAACLRTVHIHDIQCVCACAYLSEFTFALALCPEGALSRV